MGFWFLPRWCFLRGRSPAYPFFRKEKIHSHSGVESTTQKVPSVFCYARDFLRGGALYAARNPPVRATAWRRHPCHAPDVPSERSTRGPSQHSALIDALCEVKSRSSSRKNDPSLCRNPSAAQKLPRTQGGAFFFTKKAYCGNQTACLAESRKSVQTQPPLFPPLISP